MKKDFLPIILGSDENAYGNVRLIREAYDVRPLILAKRLLIPTRYSTLFDYELIDNFDTLDELADLLDRAIKDEDTPLLIKDGGIIKKGYDSQVDEYRELAENGKDAVRDIEIREKVYFLVVRRTLRHILKEMECSRDERVLSQRSIFQ